MKILAVQLPANCYFDCWNCRLPDHGEGDIGKVTDAINLNSNKVDEVYLTSNGETGLFPGFKDLVSNLIAQNKKVSVLCASQCSVVPGLTRVEISFRSFMKEVALCAIKKAQMLNIPIALSFIDDGKTDLVPEVIALNMNVDAMLVRALQPEGRSSESHGTTRYQIFSKKDIGIFPLPAYREIPSNGHEIICIDHFGKLVPYLGGSIN